MAYAALVSLAQTIHTLTEQKHDHYPLSLHHKQRILSFNKHIIILQEFLEDFPHRAKVNSLEGRIRDVANEAEDIIEFFMWEQTHTRLRFDNWRFLPTNYFVKFRSKLQFKHHWKTITKEIDSITAEVMAMSNNRDDTLQLGTSSSPRPAPAGSGSDDMVGFHDDLLAIKHRLCGMPRELQIIPIVGMGGIGKTTLARNAYDDQLTVEHFDIRAWVTVSHDHSVREVLSSLLVSLKLPNEEASQSNEVIKVKVYKILKYRR